MKTTKNQKPLWKRLENEPSKPYAAFCIYRDMGLGRSISQVGERWSESGSTSRLRKWSVEYQWVKRATAYDEHLDDVKLFHHEEAIIEMSERHAREAMLFQEKAILKLASLNIHELKPPDIIKFYESAVRIERLSRGVPTEKIQQEIKKGGKEDAVTSEKLQDPNVREAANNYIRAVANSKGSSNGSGTDSE